MYVMKNLISCQVIFEKVKQNLRWKIFVKVTKNNILVNFVKSKNAILYTCTIIMNKEYFIENFNELV